MKLTKEEKKVIADSQKIHSAIGGELKKNSNEVKDKVDLTDIAKSLADRRKRVLRDNDDDDDTKQE